MLLRTSSQSSDSSSSCRNSSINCVKWRSAYKGRALEAIRAAQRPPSRRPARTARPRGCGASARQPLCSGAHRAPRGGPSALPPPPWLPPSLSPGACARCTGPRRPSQRAKAASRRRSKASASARRRRKSAAQRSCALSALSLHLSAALS